MQLNSEQLKVQRPLGMEKYKAPEAQNRNPGAILTGWAGQPGRVPKRDDGKDRQ